MVEELLGSPQGSDALYSCGEAFDYGGWGACVSWGFSWPCLACGEGLLRAGSAFGIQATLM